MKRREFLLLSWNKTFDEKEALVRHIGPARALDSWQFDAPKAGNQVQIRPSSIP